MKKKTSALISVLFSVVLLCYFVIFQNKTKPIKLLQDFDYLIKELKLQHQGIYQYESKNEVDKKITTLRKSIEKPMTKLEFYRLVRKVISLTNEGHTSASLSDWEMIKVGLSKTFLPLSVKFCDKELIITQNYGKRIKGLKKGMKLLSINGEKIEDVIEKLFLLIPTDGFNVTSKYEWIGGINFSLLYVLTYGKTDNYFLEVQKYGSSKVQKIRIPSIRHISFKSSNSKYTYTKPEYLKFTFKQINDSIAYMSIPSFGDDDVDYQLFYASNFKKIASLDIKHLILDIQANIGGTEGNENLLFSYFTNSIIKKYKKVTMLPKPYHKNKTDEDYIFDKWGLHDSIATRGDFTLLSNYYSNLGYKTPSSKLIYKNALYVLTSGVTYSGGAEFASLIKMTHRGVFIGEETGGTYEGNVSGYSETIELPNTKITVDIPTVHFQINVMPKTRGKGVKPDYKVPQIWNDYLKNNNSKLNFAIQLIQKVK